MAEKNLFETIFTKRDNIVVIIFIVASLAGSRIVYQKQMAKYVQLKGSITDEEEKGKSLDRIVLLNENIKQFKAKSWDTLDTNAIIEKIYNIGLESQIKIRDISPKEKRDEKNYILIPFGLSCEATYKDLFRFMRRLETYPMLLRVKTVAAGPMARMNTAERELLLGVGLELEAVYMK
ncbi:MAG: type 4a pilus biogenesis protein PilO [bacterium]